MAKKNTNTKDWTRGGQIVDHNIRMISQIAKKVFLVTTIFSMIYVVTYTALNTESNTRKLAFNYYFSSMMNIAFKDGINQINFNNQKLKLKHHKVANSSTFKLSSKKFETVVIVGTIQSLILSIFIYFLISIYIGKRGAKEQGDKFMRGGSIVDNKEFKKNIKNKDLNKNLSLGVIPTLLNSEIMHFHISGGPRTGKSQTLKHLIRDIRNRGDRAVIYSTSNEFISSFYDEKKDVILNPLDDRSPSWNPWNEVEEIYHYDDIASSVIPESEGSSNDPFFIPAARTLLANTMQKFGENNNHDVRDLLQKLLNIKHKDIAKMLKNTESAALVAEGGERTTAGITATLANYVKSFKFLRTANDDFSIRKWVKDEADSGCVFITSRNDQHQTLKSLISCWVDIFATSVMSLTESRERRIWLIIDELPSLHKLGSLKKMMAESPKYGGCFVIGFQAYSQVEEIYGPKGASSLIGGASSKIMFRANNQLNAKWASEELGREEIKTTNENITVSAQETRDAVSMSENEKLKELVLPTQIMNLNNLCGFYKLPGNYPVVSFKQDLFKDNQEIKGFIGSNHSDHIYMKNSNIDNAEKNIQQFFNNKNIKDYNKDQKLISSEVYDDVNTDDFEANPLEEKKDSSAIISHANLMRGFD
jgi:type IV conjugative transfer system coupling protein TraD